MNFTSVDPLLERFSFPTRPASDSNHALDARLFGAPHLLWRGEPLQLSSQKGRALLYLLALRPEGVSRDELAELFWGVGRYANLRQALYQLRRLPGAAQWLRLEGSKEKGERVRVNVASDVAAFGRAMGARRYEEALALSAAPLLAGVRAADAPAFDGWLAQRRAAVEEARRTALRGEIARLEKADHLLVALELTEKLIASDPLDETSYRAAMRLHYRRGDLAAARARFTECRRILLRELGAEPLAETLELAHLIEKSRARTLPTPRVTLPLQLLRPPHLVGREAVWAQLAAAQRAGQVIFLAGAAGVGKTRLLRDFTNLGSSLFNEAKPGDVHSPYIVIARGIHRFLQAFPEVQLEPWEQLALARLLPQHAPPRSRGTPGLTPSPLDTPSKHLRFTEAVASLFARIRRSVAALPFDDIHYTDHASYVLMAQTFGQLSPDKNTASLIVAYRPEETPPSFARYLAPLLESGAGRRIELEPLTLDGVGELVESLELPGGVSLARRLYRYAGGNPMLTLEALKSMLSDLSAAPTLDLGDVSQGSAPLRRRLETLSNVALRVVRAKALTRDELPTPGVHALAELVEMSPLSVAEGLAELQRAQILSGRTLRS